MQIQKTKQNTLIETTSRHKSFANSVLLSLSVFRMLFQINYLMAHFVYLLLKEKKLRLNVSQPDRHAVVMSFFATWCKPCMKELPILEEVYQDYKDKRVKFFLIDITEATRNNPGTVYGMSYKDVPVAGPFLREKGVTMQILFDNRGTAMKRYYAQTLPRLFMVDGFRNVTFKKRGFPDEEGAEAKFNKDISAEIDKLLGELPPSKK